MGVVSQAMKISNQLPSRKRGNISHQTGKPENHRLKSIFGDIFFVPGRVSFFGKGTTGILGIGKGPLVFSPVFSLEPNTGGFGACSEGRCQENLDVKSWEETQQNLANLWFILRYTRKTPPL